MHRCLFVAALLASCAPERCELASGIYLASFVESSGTCGALPSGETVISGDLGPPFSGASSDCVGPFTISDDLCSVDYERACEAYNDVGEYLGSVRFTGTNSSVSAERVEGNMVVESSIGAGCRSVYEATWVMR